ncbi:hypothetical protein M885DRAFT_563818 [Pelagophyceae sp. CCMP2097]|nr:hypothetical protein M885DRAFT_563818 [Pelagophyceae sp. CCMP2097]
MEQILRGLCQNGGDSAGRLVPRLAGGDLTLAFHVGVQAALSAGPVEAAAGAALLAALAAHGESRGLAAHSWLPTLLADESRLVAAAPLRELLPDAWRDVHGGAVAAACVAWLARGETSAVLGASVADFAVWAVGASEARLADVVLAIFDRLCHDAAARSLGRLASRLPLRPAGLALVRRRLDAAAAQGAAQGAEQGAAQRPFYQNQDLTGAAERMARWSHRCRATSAGDSSAAAEWIVAVIHLLAEAGRPRAVDLAVSAAALVSSARLRLLAQRKAALGAALPASDEDASDEDASDALGCAITLDELLIRQRSDGVLRTVLPNLVEALRGGRLCPRASAVVEATLRTQLLRHAQVRLERHEVLRLLGPDAAAQAAAARRLDEAPPPWAGGPALPPLLAAALPPTPDAAAAACASMVAVFGAVRGAKTDGPGLWNLGSATTDDRPGLWNLGNSCYLNASVRALELTRPLRDLLVSRPAPAPRRRRAAVGAGQDAKPSVTPALRETFALMAASRRPAIAPVRLKRTLPEPFDGTAQQDAAEVLHCLLAALDDEADLAGDDDDDAPDGAPAGDATAAPAAGSKGLSRILGGVYETTIVCDECGAVSRARHELGGELPLSLEDDGAAGKPPAKRQRLDALVREQYLAAETLEGETAYRCDRCAKLVTATRSGAIVEPPSHVVLALSRFRYDPAAAAGKGGRRKISTLVDAPEFLELPCSLGAPGAAAGDGEADGGRTKRYALYAIVVHEGASPHHGHYYTYGIDSSLAATSAAAGAEAATAADGHDRSWRLYDDSRVRRVSRAQLEAADAARATPYLLWYAEVAAAAAPPPQAPLLPELQRLVDDDNAALDRARAAPAAAAPRLPPRGGGGGGVDGADEPYGGAHALGGGGPWGIA